MYATLCRAEQNLLISIKVGIINRISSLKDDQNQLRQTLFKLFDHLPDFKNSRLVDNRCSDCLQGKCLYGKCLGEIRDQLHDQKIPVEDVITLIYKTGFCISVRQSAST
ncbi:MAG: hypothetical protein HQL77_18965 [Magnetococcales bacterium]|nr:hypothetical protein [Magnetococcales bacterium]